ncbi:phosphoribosyltransferase family protein [Actinomycetes bacterium KLBMP 9797]
MAGPPANIRFWSRYLLLRAEAEALPSSGITTELFERLCSLEQTVSDIAAVLGEGGADGRWRDRIEGLRAASVAAASALWFGAMADDTWSVRIGQLIGQLPDGDELDARWRKQTLRSERLAIFDYLDTWPIWPECLSTEPVDYQAYAQRVADLVHSMGSAAPQAVVGLRTSGSFLGAIWTAALRVKDRTVRLVTARPLHPSLRMRDRTLPSMLDVSVDTASLRGLRTVVVDDLTGTGTTIRSVLEFLSNVGVPRSAISVSLYRCASARDTAKKLGISPSNLLTVRRVYARWPQARRQAPPLAAVRSYFQRVMSRHAQPPEVVEASLLDYSYPLRYLSAATGAHAGACSAYVHGGVRHRRYLLRIRTDEGESTLLAKPLGFGYFAADELGRLAMLPHYPRVHDIVGGYLLYAWQPGCALPFRDRTGIGRIGAADLDTVGAVAAATFRHAPGGIVLPREGVAPRIRAVISELERFGIEGLPTADDVIRALDDQWLPIVAAAPNNGHWHYVRRANGALLKLHRELGNVQRRSDPVEDIGAAGVELDLTPAEVMHVAEVYAGLSGDVPSPGRLAFGAMQHICRALREFAYYREHVARWMGCPVVDGDNVFTRREQGLRDAIGLAVHLLEQRGPTATKR